MPISQKEREEIARRIEHLLTRAASSVRDHIIQGDNMDEACNKAEFWTERIEAEAKKLL